MSEDTNIMKGDSSSSEKKSDRFVEVDRRYSFRFMKRAFDLVFSLLVCATLLIPCLILCLVIVIGSRGLPVYVQERVGRYGRSLSIYKFRTMVSDADDLQKYLNEKQLEEWLLERKVTDDPRVTGIGRFLRATSLDELPQFVNVLKGEMSVVGPRPVTADELSYFRADTKKLLKTKPGITGWWQVAARNDATFADGSRQAIEMFYVDNQSFAFDVKIFFKTFQAIFGRSGR